MDIHNNFCISQAISTAFWMIVCIIGNIIDNMDWSVQGQWNQHVYMTAGLMTFTKFQLIHRTIQPSFNFVRFHVIGLWCPVSNYFLNYIFRFLFSLSINFLVERNTALNKIARTWTTKFQVRFQSLIVSRVLIWLAIINELTELNERLYWGKRASAYFTSQETMRQRQRSTLHPHAHTHSHTHARTHRPVEEQNWIDLWLIKELNRTGSTLVDCFALPL